MDRIEQVANFPLSVAVLGRYEPQGRGNRIELIRLADKFPSEETRHEWEQDGLCFVGVFGYDRETGLTYQERVEGTDSALLMAFAASRFNRYVQECLGGTDWLDKLWALPDPRPEQF